MAAEKRNKDHKQNNPTKRHSVSHRPSTATNHKSPPLNPHPHPRPHPHLHPRNPTPLHLPTKPTTALATAPSPSPTPSTTTLTRRILNHPQYVLGSDLVPKPPHFSLRPEELTRHASDLAGSRPGERPLSGELLEGAGAEADEFLEGGVGGVVVVVAGGGG